MQLREYQSAAISELRAGAAEGRRSQILCLPTGAGKTEIAAELIRSQSEAGRRSVFVADRRVLVGQASERLAKYGIPHGVVMADETRGGEELALVASAQTLRARMAEGWPEGVHLWVIDEAHTVHKAVMDRILGEESSYVIGLTATPLESRLRTHYHEEVVSPTTTDRLIRSGDLVDLLMYQAVEIDMEGAPVNHMGEWGDKTVRERATKIVGDVVSTWEEKTTAHFGGPVPTLVYSADVAHGADIVAAFAARGYDFRQVSHSGGKADDALMEAFRGGEFVGLVSVEKLVKGYDDPAVRCMIGLRPYRKSLVYQIQQMGRGMRPSEGKEYCLYLDHSGNLQRHWDSVRGVWSEGVKTLPKRGKRKSGTKAKPRVCGCGVIAPGSLCRGCGARGDRRIVRSRGEMQRIARAVGQEVPLGRYALECVDVRSYTHREGHPVVVSLWEILDDGPACGVIVEEYTTTKRAHLRYARTLLTACGLWGGEGSPSEYAALEELMRMRGRRVTARVGMRSVPQRGMRVTRPKMDSVDSLGSK